VICELISATQPGRRVSRSSVAASPAFTPNIQLPRAPGRNVLIRDTTHSPMLNHLMGSNASYCNMHVTRGQVRGSLSTLLTGVSLGVFSVRETHTMCKLKSLRPISNPARGAI
jgi:hypothetical protein